MERLFVEALKQIQTGWTKGVRDYKCGILGVDFATIWRHLLASLKIATHSTVHSVTQNYKCLQLIFLGNVTKSLVFLATTKLPQRTQLVNRIYTSIHTLVYENATKKEAT